MATFISCGHSFVSPLSFCTHFTPGGFRSCLCPLNQRKNGRFLSLKLNLVRGLELGEAKRRVSWWSCWCMKEWEEDGFAQLLKFMKNCERPEVFPSKKELFDVGNLDDKGNELGWEEVKKRDSEDFQESVQDEVDDSSLAVNSSSSPTSSGRSLEVAAMDDCGFECILNRLKRDGNIHFGFGFREKGDSNAYSGSNDSESIVQASMDAKTAGGHVSFNHNTGLGNHNGVKHSQNSSLSSTDGLTWREWSLQRAGFTGKGFKAGEILDTRTKNPSLSGTDGLTNLTWREWSLQRARSTSKEFKGEILEIRNISSEKETDASEKEIDDNEIKSRLHYLKLELSSVLQSLQSIVADSLSQKDDEIPIDSLQKHFDAYEFQENEMINAQDKLRLIRTRLAVFEGKMASALVDVQKTVEEKQKRIDEAQRALQTLRSVCIVWDSSASEVLLAGSFDGWTTKRKMERTSSGVFFVCLKLYPGKYEIKFIVDGEWKIDLLNHTVNNNGHENNLLIIQ